MKAISRHTSPTELFSLLSAQYANASLSSALFPPNYRGKVKTIVNYIVH